MTETSLGADLVTKNIPILRRLAQPGINNLKQSYIESDSKTIWRTLHLQVSFLENVTVILSFCVGHPEPNHRDVISDRGWSVIVRIRQTGGPHNLREAHTGLEPDQGEVVTSGDVIGHRGQVPARVEDNVGDPEAGAAPGDQVTHTEVNTDISRVQAVTTPGAAAH